MEQLAPTLAAADAVATSFAPGGYHHLVQQFVAEAASGGGGGGGGGGGLSAEQKQALALMASVTHRRRTCTRARASASAPAARSSAACAWFTGNAATPRRRRWRLRWSARSRGVVAGRALAACRCTNSVCVNFILC